MRLFDELRRRRVFRVGLIYLVAAWGVIQVSDVVFPRLGLPDWTVTLVIVMAIIGLPLSLALAWAFDITPEGVRRTSATPASGALNGGRAAGLVGLGMLVAIVAFGGYAYLSQPADSEPEIPLSDSRLAILPFEVRAGGEMLYLGEAMVDLLSAKLNGAGELTTVDPGALFAFLSRRAEGEPVPPDAGRLTARRFGAGHFVTGAVVELGDRLEIQARLYSADGTLVTAATVATPEPGLADGVDELARNLLADRFSDPAHEVSRVAALTTRSMPALKAHLTGEQRLRRGDVQAAVEEFEKAVALDSTFALAHFRLAVSRSWLPRSNPDFSRSDEAIANALRHDDRISQRDRTLLRAFDAYWRGDYNIAEQLTWTILNTQPDNVEALFYLGEGRFHGNFGRGQPVAEAREPLERALELDPDHPFALIHLADLAVARRDLTGFDSMSARLLSLSPEFRPQMAAYRLFLTETGGPDSLAAVFDRTSGNAIADVAWRATALLADPAVPAAFAPLLDGPGNSPSVREMGRLMAASAAAARGRWSDALRELDDLDERSDQFIIAAALLLASPLAPNDRALLERVRNALPRFAGSLNEELVGGPLLAARTRAELGLRLGSTDEARDLIMHLGELADAEVASELRSGPDDLPGYHLHALQAHLAWFEQRADDAEGHLRAPGMEMLRPAESHLLAQILERQGRSEQALARYEALPQFRPLAPAEMGFLPFAILKRAEILESLGRRTAARKLYATFARLWEDCDPELAHLRSQALRALDRLRDDRR